MNPEKPHHIVGIGGSAGGLKAYIEFFNALNCDTGMAFVVISHMLPTNAHNLLAEILAAHTRMPVVIAAAYMRIRRNHVYVISPNVDLRIKEYAFRITSPRTMNGQIDIFLSSLADEIGGGAVGVIFSGYDGDGTAGCASIKAKGGVTFAQDATATVPYMPLSATASGFVDFIMPAGRIGSEIEMLVKSHCPPL
jgi:two-component system CheB/CheR fusion protein